MTIKDNVHKVATKKTWRKIIHLLKQDGPMDALTLASLLNVSGMAVRQHLYELQKEGLVDYKEEAREMGRPAKIWRLTSDANQFFPNGYADLTVNLISSMTTAFGKEGMDKLLNIRNEEQFNFYKEHISSDQSLLEKVESLADLRTKEGYMAEVMMNENDDIQLIEKHCPICAAASVCSGFCRKEKELFQRLLGPEVNIDRTEHLLSGQSRCTYVIRKK